MFALRSRFLLVEPLGSQDVPVTLLRHPFGACQMAIERTTRLVRLARRIDMENDTRHLPLVRGLPVGIEQPQIGDYMFIVVRRGHPFYRGGMGNIGIKRGLFHNGSKCPFLQPCSSLVPLGRTQRQKSPGSLELPVSRGAD